MKVAWAGDVTGHVLVGDVVIDNPGDLASRLHGAKDLSPQEADALGRMCYFMFLRAARGARDGFVLHSANRALDSYDPVGFPREAQVAIEQFESQLLSVRTEPWHIVVDHAFNNL